jgi:hypothetical protein
MNLKDELLKYIETTPESEKVIKSKSIKEELIKTFPLMPDSNKDLRMMSNLVIFDLIEEPKCYCGNTLQFTSKDKASLYITKFGGWREFCCRLCLQKSSDIIRRRQKTNLERFGEISYAKTEEFKISVSSKWNEEKKRLYNQKRKITSITRYGVEHYSKTDKYLEARIDTCQDIYGVDNTFQLKDRVQAGQKSVLDGNISWMQTERGKDFFVHNNPMSNPVIVTKSRINRYMKNLNLVRSDFLDSIVNNDIEKFSGIIDELFEKHNKERIDVANELKISYSTLCRYIRDFNLQDRYISPRGAPSVSEREIYNFIKSHFPNAIQSNRTILKNNRELDIYISDKNFAVEYDSLYYHSEYSGMKGSEYHLSKTNQCESVGIQLLHIFDVEWNDPLKQNIIKSIIKNKLGITECRIFARKCSVIEISAKQASEFLNANHLSGFRGAKIHKGLVFNNELISVMSIGEENYSKNNHYEITRFASKLNTSVIGGMTKLFKSFELNKPVITYADRRYSSVLNSSYSGMFNSMTTTPPSWWGFHKSEYILNHRLSYTKNKLKAKFEYDYNLDSFDNMVANGYDRIWDCGNIKFYNEN